MKRVLFVVGPTASGKSALALQWAKHYQAEIINCDSVQAYQKLDIGAAKPSPKEFEAVPHHLYGYVPLDQPQTAGDYRRAFFQKLESINAQNIVVVGGTGFYFQAIEKGMFPTLPQFPEIRQKIEEELASGKELHSELVDKDPEAAQKISPNDHYRIGRALEVIRGEGRRLTDIKKEFESEQESFPYPLLKIGIYVDRDLLRRKVTQRVDAMLSEGLVEEVQALLDQGHREDLALRSIGYKEMISYLDHKISLEEAKAEIVKNTMGLAKRQMTWFRRDPEIQWLDRSKSEDLLLTSARLEAFFQGES